MKREIKFRGKRKDNGEWVYGYYWVTDIDTYITCEDETKHQDKAVIPETVGQLTGLKDKNGKGNDVYEGDTFEAIYKDCPDGFSIMGKETTVIRIKATVVFKWGSFMVEMFHPTEKELVYSNLINFLKNEEKVVIGNIYENSYLVKEK